MLTFYSALPSLRDAEPCSRRRPAARKRIRAAIPPRLLRSGQEQRCLLLQGRLRRHLWAPRTAWHAPCGTRTFETMSDHSPWNVVVLLLVSLGCDDRVCADASATDCVVEMAREVLVGGENTDAPDP